MTFSKNWWSGTRARAKGSKSPFGGKILSQSEIKRLNDRIETIEENELKEFEENLDQVLTDASQ